MVAFLAGRAYRLPTCPTTKYTVEPSSGLPQVSGQVSQEALQAWAEAAKHTDMEAARLAQQPSLNAFLGISLQGSQALGQRQYQEFKPELPPAHFLEAIRLALAASVANQNIEHFWSVFNLEWPDTTARMAVFLRRVLPLESLLASPRGETAGVNEVQTSPDVYSVSSGTESVSPASMEDLAEEADEPEAQVHDWRFSELRTTDLAALREVDVAAPFRLPVIDDEHWKGLSTTPNRHGPQRSRNAWYDAATAHWAALKGLARSKHPTKQQLNSFWFKLYCHGTPKEPEPSALAAALTTFPFQDRDEGVVQYRQIQDAIRTMWRAAQASMKRHIGGSIPTGIPEWGVSEEELPQVSGGRAHAVSAGHRPRRPDWEGPWQ